jgi:hypothetical protein
MRDWTRGTISTRSLNRSRFKLELGAEATAVEDDESHESESPMLELFCKSTKCCILISHCRRRSERNFGFEEEKKLNSCRERERERDWEERLQFENFPSICRKNNGYHITWSWTLKWLIYPSISFHKDNSKNIFNV